MQERVGWKQGPAGERVVARLPLLRKSPAHAPTAPLEWWVGTHCELESRTLSLAESWPSSCFDWRGH